MRKLLKITILLILALCLGFLAIGWLKPRLTYSSTITIDKPLEVVFSNYMNIGNLKKWIPEIRSVQIESIVPGVTGSKLKMEIDRKGKVISVSQTVTEYIYNNLITVSITTGGMTKTNRMQFIPENNKTVLKADYTCEGSGIINKSLLFITSRVYESMDETYMKNFKQFVESK